MKHGQWHPFMLFQDMFYYSLEHIFMYVKVIAFYFQEIQKQETKKMLTPLSLENQTISLINLTKITCFLKKIISTKCL